MKSQAERDELIDVIELTSNFFNNISAVSSLNKSREDGEHGENTLEEASES